MPTSGGSELDYIRPHSINKSVMAAHNDIEQTIIIKNRSPLNRRILINKNNVSYLLQSIKVCEILFLIVHHNELIHIFKCKKQDIFSYNI